jgi:hypothetical protein
VLSALALAASASAAAPIRLPMPDGEVESRDERDVAPYLAAWKVAALERGRAPAAPATANQQSYDVGWYDLDLTFNPAGTTVAGTVRMKAAVVGGPIATVDLDLAANLVVDAATSAAVPTTWSRAGDVLTLNLDRVYADGESLDVTVTYHGNPTAAGSLVFTTANGRQLIWSLSEPFGARTWWPCKDAPADKADSVDIRFTVPAGLVTASNGTLVSTTPGAGTVTTHWRERCPIATYLVSIASYPYSVVDDWYRPSPVDSMLIRFHVFPESVAGAAAVHAKVKDMIAGYAARMGEYPFLAEKYGHAQFTFGGGMEHQTCSSMGTFAEYVVAHELMHQWWGDLVTCRDFHHIWLNEGFATWGEALWAEIQGGPAAYRADLDLNRYYGPGTIHVPDVSSTSRIFDSNLSYNKGSWVVHMLRGVLGDSTFFAALREYRAQWGYRSATTEDLQAVCEQMSGRDLDAFFQQWIYGEYYPVYKAGWSAEPAGGGWDVTITLEQRQSWQLFTMPVGLTVATTGSETTFVVQDSLASQTFVVHVGAEPTGVEVDRDGWILKKVETVVADATFERAVLLVNGIDWATYGSEVTSAYDDEAFSGGYAVDFWDCFAAPAGGYPSTLPAPLGHGPVPAAVLGQYRNVIWVGNHYAGDLVSWEDTPVLSYLRAGGNLLLMARYGNTFLGDSLRDYLGVTWTGTNVTLNDCLATRPGLVNQSLLASQSLCAVFDTVLASPESQLLFRAGSGFSPSRGIGAIRVPAAGAGTRPNGGRFAFLSGRPYRWNHAQLGANVATLLDDWFLEPASLLAAGGPAAAGLDLAPARPNPSGGAVRLGFTLPRAARARLLLYDVTGRRVRTLVDGPLGAGVHARTWDGREDGGARAPAGLYFARLEAAGGTAACRIVRVN